MGRETGAGELGSSQGRGGSRRRCSLAGAGDGASALGSLAPSPAPPPSAPGVCVFEGQFRQALRTPLVRRGDPLC